MNNKYIALVALVFASSLNVHAQNGDTLKVGLNDQMIQVDAPENNQKVTVLIEDSTFTYKVEISKLENRSIDDKIKDMAKMDKTRRKSFSSSWFRSAEFGINTLAFKEVNNSQGQFSFLLDSVTEVKESNYTHRSYSSTGSFWGMYLDYTIRERRRPSKRLENVYVKRKSHVRLDHNSVNGRVHFDNYFGSGILENDSLISTSSVERRINITNLQLSQLITYGYDINREKDIALEYGINVGLQFTLSSNNEESINTGSENTVNNFTLFDNYVANPFVRIQHHAAYNVGKYSVNAKMTYLAKRFGNTEQRHIKGNIFSLGLGYKF